MSPEYENEHCCYTRLSLFCFRVQLPDNSLICQGHAGICEMIQNMISWCECVGLVDKTVALICVKMEVNQMLPGQDKINKKWSPSAELSKTLYSFMC